MPKSIITLQCTECGEYIEIDEYNKYTGHRYSPVFNYSCTACKGRMQQVSYADGGACARVLNYRQQPCQPLPKPSKYLFLIRKRYRRKGAWLDWADLYTCDDYHMAVKMLVFANTHKEMGAEVKLFKFKREDIISNGG